MVTRNSACGRIDIVRFVAIRSRSGRYGGPSDTAASQAVLLTSAGHNVLLASGFLKGDKPDSVIDNEICIQSDPLIHRLGLPSAFSFRLVWRLTPVLRRARIIHVSLCREAMPILVALLAIGLRRELVVQPHGMLTSRKGAKQSVLDLLVRPLYRRARTVIAISHMERDDLLAWEPRQLSISVVGNPAPRQVVSEPALTDPEFDALYLGRIEARKRVDVFIEAARICTSRGRALKFRIVGPADGAADDLLSTARELGIRVDDPVPPSLIDQVLRQSRMLVLPSWREPWGNVLVASMRAGIPVIVAKSAALSDVVAETGAGLVVPDGDAEALASAIESLKRDPVALAEAGRRARQAFATFFDDARVTTELQLALVGDHRP